MLLKIFTVYDAKAEAYMQPFFMQSTGQAIRSFEDTVNDTKSVFNKHAQDFTLFEIGTYEDSNCFIQQHEAKIPLGTAQEYIKQSEMYMPDQPSLKQV